MNPETRDKLREAARRQNNCPKCGSSEIAEQDGAECDGLPGIRYRVCMACGHATANPRRGKKP